jgi:formylmethanofuran dehydrogenase subunit C
MTRLTLKAEPPVRLALDSLLPERLAGLKPGEIERLPLVLGKREEKVGDWFRLDGSGGDSLVIAGEGERLDRIGAAMTAGRIIVEGAAGAYLGQGLAGGEIRLEGAAGFGLASDMRGGLIRVAGDAGDGVGGALPGTGSGMSGGTVIITGTAGARCGYQLRRGLLVVGGDAGPACGGAMLAGTILLGGRAQAYAGAAMRHGSLLALGGFERPGPTFIDSGVHELVALRLLARLLASLGLGALAARLGPMRRLLGDQAIGGKGELLAPA